MSKELEISHLFKSFAEVDALVDINLELEKGEMLAVLGPSGCGKTTLLRSIAGFGMPDRGTIVVGGRTVFSKKTFMRPEKRRIGYVPQEGILFPHLSVARNIGFGLPRGRQRAYRVDEMLELVGMSGLGDRMPHQLSGGQQQRIALARALAPAPSLVLLDEPFSALDAGLRASLREDVKTSLRQVAATAIMVTQDQEEALSMADRVSVMLEGACIQTDTPFAVYTQPADLRVAEFVGDATILDGELLDGEVTSRFGRLPVSNSSPARGHQATIMVRPEQIIIDPTRHDISGQVEQISFYGHDAMIHLRLDDSASPEIVQVRVVGHPDCAPGEHVGLRIEGEVVAYPENRSNAIPRVPRCPVSRVS